MRPTFVQKYLEPLLRNETMGNFATIEITTERSAVAKHDAMCRSMMQDFVVQLAHTPYSAKAVLTAHLMGRNQASIMGYSYETDLQGDNGRVYHMDTKTSTLLFDLALRGCITTNDGVNQKAFEEAVDASKDRLKEFGVMDAQTSFSRVIQNDKVYNSHFVTFTFGDDCVPTNQ